MLSPSLLPESPDEKDTAKFLRRFSELISVGQSASYLRHAAGLIDQLIERIRQGDEQIREQQAIAQKNIDLRRAAELQLQSAKAELFEVKAAHSVESLKLKLASSNFTESRQQLAERCELAEAKLAEVSSELALLQARFACVGETHAVVAISTLLLLRAQFLSLAKEFRTAGDAVSDVMCTIGVRTIDQAMTDAAR